MTDADQFEAFVRRFQDMVYATALRLLGNVSEAEDIAQQVFLRAYQRFAEIGTSPEAGGWLKTVTRNACLNHLTRYRARWRFFSELPEAETGQEPPEDRWLQSASTALEGLEQAERQHRLEVALGRLPDHQRVPIVLHHIEDMGYQDIADALGVSLGKIKTDIHRGRLALRRLLSGELHGDR
jgi:RNA polymerase sigma-70 factor (ECF subfamily)